jgi:hypothetical protein
MSSVSVLRYGVCVCGDGEREVGSLSLSLSNLSPHTHTPYRETDTELIGKVVAVAAHKVIRVAGVILCHKNKKVQK